MDIAGSKYQCIFGLQKLILHSIPGNIAGLPALLGRRLFPFDIGISGIALKDSRAVDEWIRPYNVHKTFESLATVS